MMFDGEVAGGAGEGAGGAGGTSGGTGTADTPAWHVGLPEASVGYLQNKGWLDADPKAAMGKILSSYQEAEKVRGIPVNELIRKPPANADVATQRAFYEALGAPKEATGYEIAYEGHDESGAKIVQGQIAQAAFELGIPKAAAEQFFTKTLEALALDVDRTAAEGEAAYASEMASLRANWGANFDANMFIARQAAKAFNVSEEMVDAMQSGIGAKAVMEFFREVGTKIGEDRYVTGSGQPGSGIMTREMAISRRAEVMKDPEWIKRFSAGGAQEKAEFQKFTSIIAGGA